MGGDRHVGDFRCRAFSGTPPEIRHGAASVAHRSYGPRGDHRRRWRSPRHAGRWGDGDDLEGCSLRAGSGSDHTGHGRLTSVENADEALEAIEDIIKLEKRAASFSLISLGKRLPADRS